LGLDEILARLRALLKSERRWLLYAAGAVLIIVVAMTSLPEAQRKPAPPKTRMAQEPTITLRIASSGETRKMLLEEYVAGAVAGQMKNDWPAEALKAQAIVARTFVVQRLLSGEKSRFGTDLSTDPAEALPYDPSGITPAMSSAARQTRGLVLTYGGNPILAFFHPCSGGKTATAAEGLGVTMSPTPYLIVVDDGPCSAPDLENWQSSFAVADVAKELGIGRFKTASIISRGPSGRAWTVLLGNQSVSAVGLRNLLGPDKMKSTLLTSFSVVDGQLRISGKGSGHGVGMSQWGARDRAVRGETARLILATYYPGTLVERFWP